jgi:hypothetical protein
MLSRFLFVRNAHGAAVGNLITQPELRALIELALCWDDALVGSASARRKE